MRRTIFRSAITGVMAVVFMASQATMVAYASDKMVDFPYAQNKPETGNGGAIYQTDPVTNTDFTNNYPESNGGAIYYMDSVSGKEFEDDEYLDNTVTYPSAISFVE